jgi:hypothetical protein
LVLALCFFFNFTPLYLSVCVIAISCRVKIRGKAATPLIN